MKAFNNLPRLPLLAIAAWVGFPANIIRPWTSFLARTSRRFQVHQSVSCEVLSTSGFPEGDPMSPIAMVLADWVFHRYLQVYAPSLRSLSFVDNLAFIAPTPGLLMHGYALTGCYCDMLDLELDLGKTFVWSTSSTGRRALKCQDLPVFHRPESWAASCHTAKPTAMHCWCSDVVQWHCSGTASVGPKHLLLSSLPFCPANFGPKPCTAFADALWAWGTCNNCEVLPSRLQALVLGDPILSFAFLWHPIWRLIRDSTSCGTVCKRSAECSPGSRSFFSNGGHS